MAHRSSTASEISKRGNPGVWAGERDVSSNVAKQLAKAGITIVNRRGKRPRSGVDGERDVSAPQSRRRRTKKGTNAGENAPKSRRPGYVKTNVRLRTKTRRKLEELADLSEMTLSAIIHMVIEDKWVRVQRKLRAEERKAEKSAAEASGSEGSVASSDSAEPTPPQTASSAATDAGDD